MNTNYAGFWIRVVAVLIDGLFLLVLQFILGFILGFIFAIFGSKYPSFDGLGTVLTIITSIAYWVFYQHKVGQTLGKKALGLKVVDTSGNTPSLLTFFLREVIGKFVSALILGIGYIMVAFDSKKQGLHDKIAGTYVVKIK